MCWLHMCLRVSVHLRACWLVGVSVSVCLCVRSPLSNADSLPPHSTKASQHTIKLSAKGRPRRVTCQPHHRQIWHGAIWVFEIVTKLSVSEIYSPRFVFASRRTSARCKTFRKPPRRTDRQFMSSMCNNAMAETEKQTRLKSSSRANYAPKAIICKALHHSPSAFL